MATNSYTIYSHHKRTSLNSPVDSSGGDLSDSWEFDPAFKPPPPPPPRFVSASHARNFDDRTPLYSPKLPSSSDDIPSWYRSLTNSSLASQARPSLTARATSPSKAPTIPSLRLREERDKNNWFIMNVMESDPAIPPTCRSSAPSLAEMVARDPPPLPHEQKYEPPVWLAIGPSNKGFSMMQRSGWSEGEALGSDKACQPTVTAVDEPEQGPSFLSANSRSDHQDVSIDVSKQGGSSDRISLLRPIATTLKSDRLGIGLKAKTIGPHKASQKRITHSEVALAAHAKTAEESRRRRRLYGRGRRGLAVQKKRKDEQDRQNTLAYLNS